MIHYCSGLVGLNHVQTDAARAVTPMAAAGTAYQWPWMAAQRANTTTYGASPPGSLAGSVLPGTGSGSKRTIRSIVTGNLQDTLLQYNYMVVGTDATAPQGLYAPGSAGGMPAPEFSIWGLEGNDMTWTAWFTAPGLGKARQLASGFVIGGGLALPADIPIPESVRGLVCVSHYTMPEAAGTLLGATMASIQAFPRLVLPVTLCVDY